MGKKILIGSMLVLTLLLLMPSIPAIQQKTIEEGIEQDLQEKLDSITLHDFKDIDVLDGIKYPILYDLVLLLGKFRFEKFIRLLAISTDGLIIERPFLFFWSVLWVGPTYVFWIEFWNNISDKLGWGWNIPFFPECIFTILKV